MSIHAPILRSLFHSLGRTRVVDDRGSYKGYQILIAALHVASAIKPKCDTPTVGVMMPTSVAFPLGALAAWSLGKTIVPLNYLLKQDELQYVIDDSGMDTLVTARALLEHLGYTPKVKSILCIEDVQMKAVPEPLWPQCAEPQELGVLIYTSGTSGKPKGVMLTHANVRANIEQIQEWINIGPQHTFLGVLPQFHSFGMTALTLLPLAVGSKVVFTARFVPNKIYNLLREHRPNVFVAIPSMYTALLHSKQATADDWKSVKYVVSGGEPLPQAVFDGFRERFGVTLNEGYGLTETSPVSNWCRPEEWRPRSVGKALPRIHQRIVDPATNRELPPNTDGEVQMRGPNIMSGYYKLPDETAKVFTPDGYFKTGDMGQIDDEGHLFITGRIKEMLIVGGENVFPREIEEVLNQHADVAASGVIGTTDPLRGELPIAFVEPKEGHTPDQQALKNWCRERLAGYKVPTEIRVVEKLPRNPTGKIMRRELKKLI